MPGEIDEGAAPTTAAESDDAVLDLQVEDLPEIAVAGLVGRRARTGVQLDEEPALRKTIHLRKRAAVLDREGGQTIRQRAVRVAQPQVDPAPIAAAGRKAETELQSTGEAAASVRPAGSPAGAVGRAATAWCGKRPTGVRVSEAEQQQRQGGEEHRCRRRGRAARDREAHGTGRNR